MSKSGVKYLRMNYLGGGLFQYVIDGMATEVAPYGLLIEMYGVDNANMSIKATNGVSIVSLSAFGSNVLSSPKVIFVDEEFLIEGILEIQFTVLILIQG